MFYVEIEIIVLYKFKTKTSDDSYKIELYHISIYKVWQVYLVIDTIILHFSLSLSS